MNATPGLSPGIGQGPLTRALSAGKQAAAQATTAHAYLDTKTGRVIPAAALHDGYRQYIGTLAQPESVKQLAISYHGARGNGEKRPFAIWVLQEHGPRHAAGYLSGQAAPDAHSPEQAAILQGMRAMLNGQQA